MYDKDDLSRIIEENEKTILIKASHQNGLFAKSGAES